MKSVIGGVTTVFIGGYYEWNSNGTTKYYGLGASVSAMRKESGGSVTLYWMLGDHLGSVSLILTGSGNQINPLEKVTYTPWGSILSGSITLTMKGFTGQYREDSLGLYFYNARWVDVSLGRFVQADSIVPNGFWPLSFDRYAYVLDNPVNLVDPSGHATCDEEGNCWERGKHVSCGTWGPYCKPPWRQNSLEMKMPNKWEISQEGLDFIKIQEGFSDRPYNDLSDPQQPEIYFNTKGQGKGNCTIGWGHKIHDDPCDGRRGEDIYNNYSVVEFENLLKKDLESAIQVVKRRIKVPITQHMFDALVSLIFNWGFHLEYPTKINLINDSKYIEAGFHFLQGPIDSGSNKQIPGLMRRRYAEALMFLSGYDITLPTLEEYMNNPLNVYYP